MLLILTRSGKRNGKKICSRRRSRARKRRSIRNSFDCYVRKEWPAQKVADQLGVSVGQVYLARHRVAAVLKKEVKALEKLEGHAPS